MNPMNLNSPLISKLASLHDTQFTGIITVTTKNTESWNIYLYLGKLLWTESTIHRNRFWQRNLSKLCPQLASKKYQFKTINTSCISDYYLINVLLGDKLVTREKILELIDCCIKDNFFEILQYEFKHSINFAVQCHSPLFLLKSGFNLSLQPLKTLDLVAKAEQNWLNWLNKGLGSCSPNLAPLIKNNQDLEKQLSPIIFKNMTRLLNGKNTLRDLAVKMDKHVLEVTLGLIPYFFKGYLRLLEIPDTTQFMVEF